MDREVVRETVLSPLKSIFGTTEPQEFRQSPATQSQLFPLTVPARISPPV